ncbi:MAG: C2H2-type zinc finger protein [Clostridia bacterium]|nr:C2H2-type zinc finger protein [Clostridia bacterium]
MNQRTFHSSMKRNVRRHIRKHSGGVRIVAVFLATVMAFSALSANVSSIVRLMDVRALAPGEEADGQ